MHRVGLAVSDDLTRWRKWGAGPVNERDPRFYERLGPERGAFGQWRDPFLFVAGDRIYQYVSARSKARDRSRRGGVGLAVSEDMSRWEVRPPLQVTPFATEIEVPQVYAIGRRYYLVCCTQRSLLESWFARQHPDHPFRDSDYAMVGEHPVGPFSLHGTGEILPPDVEERPYASRLVAWRGAWYLLGTVRRKYISDPVPVTADAKGIRASGSLG